MALHSDIAIQARFLRGDARKIGPAKPCEPQPGQAEICRHLDERIPELKSPAILADHRQLDVAVLIQALLDILQNWHVDLHSCRLAFAHAPQLMLSTIATQSA